MLPGDRPGDAPLWGVLLSWLAAISWAAGSFYSKRMDLPEDGLVSTAWQMLLGGAAMIVVGLLVGEAGDVDPAAFSPDSLLAFAYLITIGSLLAFTAYTWLLKNAPISTVTTYAYVNPVIAVLLGAVVLSEEVTASVVAGAAAIVLSVATVVRGGVRRRRGSRRERGYSGQDASSVVAPRITFKLSSAHLRRVGEMSMPSRSMIQSAPSSATSLTSMPISSSLAIEADACEIAQPWPWNRRSAIWPSSTRM